MPSYAVILEDRERPPVIRSFPNIERLSMQSNAAVQALLEDVQLGGLPVASVADAEERTTRKRKPGSQGRGRANIDAQEKVTLQSR